MLRVRKLLILGFAVALLGPQLVACFEGFHKARFWPFLAYDMYSRARSKGEDTGIYELWIYDPGSAEPTRERLGTSLLWLREGFVPILARAADDDPAAVEVRDEARARLNARALQCRKVLPERLEVRRCSIATGSPLEIDSSRPESWRLVASWSPSR